MTSFKLIKPTVEAVPILLSIPHCGVKFPEELKRQYKPELIAAPDDTDWFVHQLYDFAASMGITTIHAIYSRWVIDLNRDPSNEPLYKDGRIITGLCPTTTFSGEPLYLDNRTDVHQLEINRRLESYYQPYHNQIKKKLFELKSTFGKVLLWECHSIRQFVPTVFPEKFPDLILGTNDEQSASKEIIDSTLAELKGSKFSMNHNFPFKGGYITRHFGKPSENQHAMQLEMSKVNYMDDTEMKFDEARANKVRGVLKKVFNTLIRKVLA